MEGPTPVSSLIHAATMVTAGVYLIARTHALFVLAPTAADIAAFVGLATLLVAGTIALVMTDLKRAIAYSTMSQIGYMIMGVSIGAYSAGMFHLMTHAFFKALLFMAAGSIIAAMANEQNIDEMSGFGKAMRFTSITMLCGGLALAAFPGTSGFFSKDEILAYADGARRHVPDLHRARLRRRAADRDLHLPADLPGPARQALQGGAGADRHRPRRPRRRRVNPATGEEEDTDVGFPGAEHHIAEQSWPMRVAMGVLAFLALFAGLIQVPGVDDVDHQLPRPGLRRLAAGRDRALGRRRLGRPGDRRGDLASPGSASPTCSTSPSPETPAMLIQRLRPLHTFLVNKWYFDELIDFLDRAPGAGDRPLRQPRLRALRRRRPGQRHRGDGRAAPAASSAPSRTASSAATRCS